LHFEPDVDAPRGERLEQLLKRVRKGRPRAAADQKSSLE
jgi:hypothetical protein